MTGVHRHAAGVPDETPRSRASIVINDPAISASQPEDQLAASSANALGHAITALVSTRSTPIARAVAHEGTQRIARGWAAIEPDRAEIALGALLAGWAVDRSGLGPHHALSQTAVRTTAIGHAEVNAALLPFTVRAMRARVPHALALLDDDLGAPLEKLAEELRDRAAVSGLGDLGTDNDQLTQAVNAAAQRTELQRVPPAMTASEIRDIYLAAAAAR
jgi:alcohol dehydrogenase class IV